MKFLDFMELLKSEPASFAALSTFAFDVDYFERRVLRTKALAKARQIVVFMDAGQWRRLTQRNPTARLLNRRYLVVPVRTAKGVFHPKLQLLLREKDGQLICGSNNLTRRGCSNNLELLNSLPVNFAAGPESTLALVQEAYRFFQRVCDDGTSGAATIARQWLADLQHTLPWLKADLKTEAGEKAKLLHTYNGSLWEVVKTAVGPTPPKRLLIVSPFFDRDAELLHRASNTWPKCDISIVAQQKTTQLPRAAVKALARRVSLLEIRVESRYLHAKLIAWQTIKGSGCIVGSANFTTAAFDSRNVEACLLLRDVGEEVEKLFDKQLPTRLITVDEFSPGTDTEQDKEEDAPGDLVLESVVLARDGKLNVSYRHQLEPAPDTLRIAISLPGQPHPAWFRRLPRKSVNAVAISAPDNLTSESRGAIKAWIVAEIGKQKKRSAPTWIVQEDDLTHEYGNSLSSNPQARIEETGEGLLDHLMETRQRDGLAKAAEVLDSTTIRFSDGEGGFRGGSRFQIRVRDPFAFDEAPAGPPPKAEEVKEFLQSLYRFIERHDKRRLRRHAKRGSINGMSNFLDVFKTIVENLYGFHRVGLVPSSQVIGQLIPIIQTAVSGFSANGASSDGYLAAVSENLRNTPYLQEVCDEHGMLAHVRAAFMIIQRIRAPLDSPPSRPRDCLAPTRHALRNAIKDLKLKEPSCKQVIEALKSYQFFKEEDLKGFEAEFLL
jgi:hypothetical protein